MTDAACILASQSAARQKLLTQAGVPFSAKPAFIDETAIKDALLLDKHPPHNIADALAEAKALKVSLNHPNALVIGSDQILECEGVVFNKAENIQELRDKLIQLSGRTHKLISSVCIAQNAHVLWRFVDIAKLRMRQLSTPFLDSYLEDQGKELLSSVGGYHIEGAGVQLFEHIDGDYFTIMGLPLLPLLSQLRLYGILEK